MHPHAVGFADTSVSLMVPTPPARAAATDMSCNYDFVTFNSCVKFDRAVASSWDVYIGQDVHMPARYGREIIACGAQFRASVWADDGADWSSYDDRYISSAALKPGWPNASPNGISAQFGIMIPAYHLDEDFGPDTDELYARVSFSDCHTGLTRNFVTGIVRGDFRS